MENDILKKSLQGLDGQDWGEPAYPSHLVTEYHRLRRVPLEELNVEDLRLLIGQVQLSQEHFDHLLPMAFGYLLNEPWVSGDYYSGDLLHAVLLVPESFWDDHMELKRTCDQIVQCALAEAAAAGPEDAIWYDTRVLMQLQQWPRKPAK